MKIAYRHKRFRQSTIKVIATAADIISTYAADGYDLTVRQLYYQFVARGLFPESRRWRWAGSRWVKDTNGTKNADPNYKWLKGIISDARLAGLLDWNSIVDRTRVVQGNGHWDSPQDLIEACAEQFQLNTRMTQETYVEVWVEKDALIGVLKNICDELDVKYFACRGYVSQSAMWRAAQRIMDADTGNHAVVLHLGDHDPSGVDMTRDIQDRLRMFGCDARVERIALTMDQVEEHNPPSDPAKVTDSRCNHYIDMYGNESWELDALDPRTITELIRNAMSEYTNKKARKAIQLKAATHRDDLRQVAEQWETLLD